MDDRFNTTAGWVLLAGIVGLGLSAVSSRIYSADKPHSPHEGGFAIEGAEEEGGTAEVSIAAALATADVAAGEKVFAKCSACHTVTQGGANGIGPNLWGVVGKGIAAGSGGYAFSSALSGHGGNWDFENLDAWLKSPRAFANGTKMSFAGLSSVEDRAAVIAYMNTLGSNLPLPAVPAAAAEPAADATDGAIPATDTLGGEAAGALANPVVSEDAPAAAPPTQ